jgi:hypothetical protein
MAMFDESEQPKRRATLGLVSFAVGLLGLVVAYAFLQRPRGEVVSGRLLLLAAMVLLCSLLAGASGLCALARRESSRAYGFFGMYFSVAGILYVTMPSLHYPSPLLVGYVSESVCAQSNSDYSSYQFNAGNLLRATNIVFPGIAGKSLSSIQHPARTVLVAETPAFIPFSWHKPKRPLYIILPKNCPNCIFNDAMDMVSFVDGHVSYIKMYWKSGPPPTTLFSSDYDPPANYDYQWSAD